MGQPRQDQASSFNNFKFVDETGTVTNLNVQIKVAGASSAHALQPLTQDPPGGGVVGQSWNWESGGSSTPNPSNDINQVTVSFDYQQQAESPNPVDCNVSNAQFGIPQSGNKGSTAWRAGAAVVTFGADYSLTFSLPIQQSSVSP